MRGGRDCDALRHAVVLDAENRGANDAWTQLGDVHTWKAEHRRRVDRVLGDFTIGGAALWGID